MGKRKEGQKGETEKYGELCDRYVGHEFILKAESVFGNLSTYCVRFLSIDDKMEKDESEDFFYSANVFIFAVGGEREARFISGFRLYPDMVSDDAIWMKCGVYYMEPGEFEKKFNEMEKNS